MVTYKIDTAQAADQWLGNDSTKMYCSKAGLESKVDVKTRNVDRKEDS
jgi:hypothetical protein